MRVRNGKRVESRVSARRLNGTYDRKLLKEDDEAKENDEAKDAGDGTPEGSDAQPSSETESKFPLTSKFIKEKLLEANGEKEKMEKVKDAALVVF